LVNTLKQVNPTAFFGVPRVYEKMEDKIKEQAKQASSFKQRICIILYYIKYTKFS